jgi:hypothetical protein
VDNDDLYISEGTALLIGIHFSNDATIGWVCRAAANAADPSSRARRKRRRLKSRAAQKAPGRSQPCTTSTKFHWLSA